MAIDLQAKHDGETALTNGHAVHTKHDESVEKVHQVPNGVQEDTDGAVKAQKPVINENEETNAKKGDVEKPEKETKSKPIVRYDEYWDMRSFSWKLRKSAKPEKKKGKENSILVVRRRIDHKGRHTETAIDIYSPIVAEALQQINETVQKTKLKQTPPVADLHLLYHSLEKLEERLGEEKSKASPDPKAVDHLSEVVNFIKDEQAADISTLSTLVPAGEITWNLLWTIFKPNTFATHFHELTEQQMVVLTRWTDVEKRCNGTFFRIACDVINDDGNSFGLAKKMFEIKEFEGATKISNLQIFPITYNTDKNKILEHARARAKRFVKMVGHQYMEITGSAMREIRSSRHEPREVRFFSFGKMIVDPKSFRLFVPDADYNVAVYQSLERTKLDDEQLAICTPIVFGYCFGVKQWGGFALDRCHDVTWQEDAFDSLVLSHARKTLVHSLVRQHKRRKDAFDDVVAGKGKGLIGLLSGKPGSGKTLTAESISQLTRQPLYTISAGELGEKPQEVDEKLTMILALAVTWNAVVLIDEADVFMQTRDDNNITRNALVSIFLRQLEYFEGILLLTTNRIANIDGAFSSRLHFFFHYPDLDFAARKQIWATFWRRAGAEGGKVIGLTDEGIAQLAERPLNGRQIKNTVASALSLAMEDDVPMEKKHADVVLDVVESWDEAVAAQDRP